MNIRPNGISSSGAYSYLDDNDDEYLVDPSNAVDWGLPLPEQAAIAPMPEPMPDERLAMGSVGGYQMDAPGQPQPGAMAPEVYDALTGNTPTQSAHNIAPVPSSRQTGYGTATQARPTAGAGVMTEGEYQPPALAGGGQSGQPAMTPEAQQLNQEINQAIPMDIQRKRSYSAPRPAGYNPNTRMVSGPDPQQVKRRMEGVDELEMMQLEANRSDAERKLAQNQAERDNALRSSMAIRQEIDDQQAKLQAQQAEYSKRWERIDEDEQELTKRTADPERLWNESPGNRIMAAIAVGLGEFGAKLAGGQNTALNIIKDTIQKDIEAQQAEIAADKDALKSRKNAYARELADGADPKFAKAKLEYLQGKYTEQALLAMAAETRDPEIRAEMEQKAMDIRMWAEERRAELDSMIKVQVNEQWDRGSAGGYSYESDADYKNRLKNTAEARNIVRREVGLPGETDTEAIAAGNKAQATAQATAQAKATTKSNERPADIRKQSDAIETVKGSIEEIVSAAGGQINPETGEITDVGTGFVFNPLYESSEKTEFRSRARAALTGYANQLVNSGAELGEAAKNEFIPTGDLLENTQAKLSAAYKDALSRERQLKQTYEGAPPRVEIERLK